MNIEFPRGVFVGYELEFCSMAGIAETVFNPLKSWYYLGRDSSLNPKTIHAHMYEIRSKTPMNSVSVDVIALMLEQLKLLDDHPDDREWHRVTRATIWDCHSKYPTKRKVFTTRQCGLHVHISWSDRRLARVLFGKLAESVVTKVKPFKQREDYCSPSFNSMRGLRYNAIRWVDEEAGHFEVRVFNGTMKLRGIMNSLLMVRNEALLVASASQAA
jgi:hypothetical protein